MQELCPISNHLSDQNKIYYAVHVQEKEYGFAQGKIINASAKALAKGHQKKLSA